MTCRLKSISLNCYWKTLTNGESFSSYNPQIKLNRSLFSLFSTLLVGITTPELRIDQSVFALIHYIYRFPSSTPSSSLSTPQDNPDISPLYTTDTPVDSTPELSDKMMIEAVVHVDSPGSIQVYADAHRSLFNLYVV